MGDCSEKELRQTVFDSLKASGVPDAAILPDRQIKVGDQGVFCADLIVVAEDKKSVIAVFEFKSNKNGVGRGVEQLHHALNLIGGDFTCYIVSNDAGRPVCAMLREDGEAGYRWVPLTNATVLIDGYESASRMAIQRERKRKNRVTKDERHQFMLISAIGGGVVVVGSVVFEWWVHREFSWKVYAMIALFYSFYAAACGYDVRFKLNDVEICIVKQNERG